MTRSLAFVLPGLALGAALALVPLRTQAWLESAPGNPVQRIRLEGRSLLGLPRRPWAARLEGSDHWGDARQGFFLAPRQPQRVEVKAWPGYRQDFLLNPIAAADAAPLRSVGEAEAFRAWFVAILEQQLDGPSPAWEAAQRDCAGLLRFAFREAWGPHTESWRARVDFRGPSVASDPAPELAGPWRRAFPTPEGWAPFAKGIYLRELACLPLGRDPGLARPGDLVFFARGGARPQPDHAMAFVRPDADGQPVLLYHTGPEGLGQPGELRRVRLEDLEHHPDPAFRPHPENPAFLGVYRWKVLADPSLPPRE